MSAILKCFAVLVFFGCLVSTFGVTQTITGRVMAVVDGDTLSVSAEGGIDMRVGLFGIYCPEVDQGFGIRAREYTARMVFQKQVLIRTRGKDQDGRILGEVVLADGRSLNEVLVNEGLAWWYPEHAPADFRFRDAEARAHKEKRGLWAEANPIPPWDWRKAKAEKHKHPKRGRSGK